MSLKEKMKQVFCFAVLFFSFSEKNIFFTELSFKEGEVITILAKPNDEWWEGFLLPLLSFLLSLSSFFFLFFSLFFLLGMLINEEGSRTGLLPSAYVKEL